MAQLAMASRQVSKDFFGRHGLTAIRLGDGKKDFRFLFGSQCHARLLVPRQDRDGGPFLERRTLDDDLTADHLSSSDLHVTKDTPISAFWT